MNLTVEPFAALKDKAQASHLIPDLAQPQTRASNLLPGIAAQKPALAPHNEIALSLPVSGG